MNILTCTCCKESKSIDQFNKKKRSKTGYTARCKICNKNAKRNWILINREKLKENNKRWLKKRPHYFAERHKERYYTDIEYNLKFKLRRRMHMSLRNIYLGKRRGIKSIKLLGCTYNEYKIYLESKFLENMTWDKLFTGEIHIDHIIPLSSFNLKDINHQKVAFHYTNTQPLWANSNLSKGDTLKEDFDINKFVELRIKELNLK